MAGTTPIYGFPYPESSDLVANYPALGQNLAEDVETELAAQAASFPSTAYTSYTPTISTSTGTAWDFGNATFLSNFYLRLGKTVFYKMFLTWGSTSVFGTGHLQISLPVAPRVNSGTFPGAATLSFRDVSTSARYSGVFRLQNSPGPIAQLFVLGAGGLMSIVQNTAPFTWAAGDSIEFMAIYEGA